jgi:hypothetical protein
MDFLEMNFRAFFMLQNVSGTAGFTSSTFIYYPFMKGSAESRRVLRRKKTAAFPRADFIG